MVESAKNSCEAQMKIVPKLSAIVTLQSPDKWIVHSSLLVYKVPRVIAQKPGFGHVDSSGGIFGSEMYSSKVISRSKVIKTVITLCWLMDWILDSSSTSACVDDMWSTWSKVSYFLLLFRVPSTFAYFRVKFLLFPTFWPLLPLSTLHAWVKKARLPFRSPRGQQVSHQRCCRWRRSALALNPRAHVTRNNQWSRSGDQISMHQCFDWGLVNLNRNIGSVTDNLSICLSK